MDIVFRKISDFERGLLYRLLVDGYSFDGRWKQCFEQDWLQFDDFFFNHLDIADRCGFVTVLGKEPIGHISWDPRGRPHHVVIGHNCIATQYKGNGYGKRQLQEAIDRIKRYDGLQKIIVGTNSHLIAPRNYERVGFTLCQRRKNEGVAAFSGDYLDYEIVL